MVGKTVGNYRLEEKIGEGGVGEVFKATDLQLHRTVAAFRSKLVVSPRMRSQASGWAQFAATMSGIP